MKVRAPLVAVLAALLLAACGGGKAASSTPPKSSSTSATTSTSTPAGRIQRLTVTPASGLRTGESVHLRATGFSPNEHLVVTECANKGTKTSAADCNITHLAPVTSNGSGVVTGTYTVTKGPFGAGRVVCAKPRSCILSVTQESPTPTEDATATLSFS